MALAALCSNVQNLAHLKPENQLDELRYLRNISFRAFIVDHQVRSGSDDEARAVLAVLEQRGSSCVRVLFPVRYTERVC